MINRDCYPELFAPIDDATIDRAQCQVSTFSAQGLADWTLEHTVTYEVGGQPYRTVVDRGESDQVILAGGEFGVGLDTLGQAARLLTIRALTGEHATVILQPNATLHEDNTNFSNDERRKLRSGDAAPVVDRMRHALDSVSADRVIGYGPSQGGVSILALGAHADVQPIAVAVVETPNVVDRSVLQLARDFLGAGANLKDNIASNFEPHSALARELVGGMSVMGTVRYLGGLVRPDNLALVGTTKRDSALAQMERILAKGGSVCHAWATGDAVSPAGSNRAISVILSSESGRYYPLEVQDNDHSITNLYVLNAAFVRRAIDLMAT